MACVERQRLDFRRARHQPGRAQNQIQIATYDIGPHLTTTLDYFADLDVAGRFAQVFYDDPNGSTAGIPPSSRLAAPGQSTPAQRYRGYQLTTNAQIAKDDTTSRTIISSNPSLSGFSRLFA